MNSTIADVEPSNGESSLLEDTRRRSAAKTRMGNTADIAVSMNVLRSCTQCEHTSSESSMRMLILSVYGIPLIGKRLYYSWRTDLSISFTTLSAEMSF